MVHPPDATDPPGIVPSFTLRINFPIPRTSPFRVRTFNVATFKDYPILVAHVDAHDGDRAFGAEKQECGMRKVESRAIASENRRVQHGQSQSHPKFSSAQSTSRAPSVSVRSSGRVSF